MPRKPKTPNPFPMSDHAAEAAGIEYASLRMGDKAGCLCPLCERTRRSFVEVWQACRKAGRAKRKAVARKCG